MRFFLLFLFLICGGAISAEPDYIVQGRKWLMRWGETYCIKKYSLNTANIDDVNDSLHLFQYSEVVNSLMYSNEGRNAVFKYIDENIRAYGNLSNGKQLKFLGCLELSDSDEFIALIKKQDRFLYQNNAGIGAVIRASGQVCPFSGQWRMITKYDTYELQKFKKGAVFPVWRSADGTDGREWVLESRDDGGDVKINSPYF
ncbi:hypothetical protein ACAK56_001581 [Salmonella enterica]|uniref:WG repeat-containing protein n=1 Tax=Salmonella montevideo TaxID=115981 RepID=A0A624AYD2_SALMO|nr:hypothetical protein [Salmonella enterica subsp. enterica serovar Montevideo]EDV3193956.1 hypothetical protein [Salmonella enterica]EDX3115489.1 hypothetical protein [Salmonella enterica subsp. enterica serovar Mississippi]